MYLVKSGIHYVKAVAGKPSFRSTQILSEAARFATADEATEWAPNVFGKSMLAAVEVVAEPVAPAAGRDSKVGGVNRFNDEPNMPWDHYMGR